MSWAKVELQFLKFRLKLMHFKVVRINLKVMKYMTCKFYKINISIL